MNYIDTSTVYGPSEAAVGKALKGWRDKVIVATKNPANIEDEKTWHENLERSLRDLDIEYIDLYLHHGLNWETYDKVVEPTSSKWMQKAKDQGLIRHICASVHDTPENTQKVIDTGYVEAVLVPYSLLDRQLEDVIAHAHEKGIGVAVMNPLAKGRLGRDVPAEEIHHLVPHSRWWSEVALQFVWSNPNVSAALSGMMTMQDVERNLAAAEGEGITPEQRQRLIEWADNLAETKVVRCTECGYCTPCPEGVNIPRVFAYYNDARVLGGWGAARRGYQRWDGWNPGKQADACTECGECEEKCPQKIPIRERLREAHAALS